MRRPTLLLRSSLVLALLLVLPAAAAPQQADAGATVRAVLFYSPLCPHCHDVMTNDIPPLLARYGDRLEIVEVDVTRVDGAEAYRAAMQVLRIPADREGVPTLVIGDTYLVGADEIPARLPGLIEAGLAGGGVPLPDIPGIAEAARPFAVPLGGVGDIPTGDAVLGYATLILVLGGLVYGIRTLLRSGAPRGTPSVAIPVLALVGLVIAGYLSWVKLGDTAAVCGPFGDCGRVQSSPYSEVLGVPVAFLGVLHYLAVGFLATALRKDGRPPRWYREALVGLALLGAFFSFYLTGLELFTIFAVCTWCLGSALVATAILVLVARPGEATEPRTRAERRRAARKG